MLKTYDLSKYDAPQWQGKGVAADPIPDTVDWSFYASKQGPSSNATASQVQALRKLATGLGFEYQGAAALPGATLGGSGMILPIESVVDVPGYANRPLAFSMLLKNQNGVSTMIDVGPAVYGITKAGITAEQGIENFFETAWGEETAEGQKPNPQPTRDQIWLSIPGVKENLSNQAQWALDAAGLNRNSVAAPESDDEVEKAAKNLKSTIATKTATKRGK